MMETTPKIPSPADAARIAKVVPKLMDLTEKVLFGDMWERPQLSKRDRSLIVCATLITTYRPEQLRVHIGLALKHGVTKEEIGEMITHLAFYGGWPAAATAANAAYDVFEANS
jgi:4-carboxymuconolactone decarboxylase